MHYHLSHIIEPAIFVGYLVIAWQFIVRRKDMCGEKNKKPREAIYRIVLIFLVCAITRVLHYFDNQFFEAISAALHFALALLVWLYVYDRQVDHITEVLNRDGLSKR